MSNVAHGVGLEAIDLCGTTRIFRFLPSRQLFDVLNGSARLSIVTPVVSDPLQWLNGLLVHG